MLNRCRKQTLRRTAGLSWEQPRQDLLKQDQCEGGVQRKPPCVLRCKLGSWQGTVLYGFPMCSGLAEEKDVLNVNLRWQKQCFRLESLETYFPERFQRSRDGTFFLSQTHLLIFQVVKPRDTSPFTFLEEICLYPQALSDNIFPNSSWKIQFPNFRVAHLNLF